MNILTNILKWLWFSSKDPSKVSLTVKMALLASIPWIIKGLGLSCMLALICIDTDADTLTQIVEEVASLTLLILTVISHLGVLYGFARKVLNSIKWKGN